MIESRRPPLRATLLVAASVLMGIAAVVNAVISVPHLQADMAEINVRPSLLQAVSLGLYFGTFAMVGLALVVFVAAVSASRSGAMARPLLAIIAAVYVTFGATAFIAWSGTAHTLGYALAGLLVGVAVALPDSSGAVSRDADRA